MIIHFVLGRLLRVCCFRVKKTRLSATNSFFSNTSRFWQYHCRHLVPRSEVIDIEPSLLGTRRWQRCCRELLVFENKQICNETTCSFHPEIIDLFFLTVFYFIFFNEKLLINTRSGYCIKN